jgi:hypothetical protein
MKAGDVFVFYQHQTNRNGEEWVEPQWAQPVHALGVPLEKPTVARGPEIARDVVFFCKQKG